MSSSKTLRKNSEIRAAEVRLIDENDDQMGVMKISEALKVAQEKGLDLVEVSPKAAPPVCKIMDFGHYLYRQKKVERKQKRLSKAHETKEIRFGIRISDHDFEVRTKRAISFLEKGHPLKVILQFKGREASHADIGLKRIAELTETLADIAKPEGEPKKQGWRNVIMEYKPLPGKKKTKASDEE